MIKLFFHPAVFLLCSLLITACGNDTAKVDYNQTGERAQGGMYVSANLGEATNLVPWLAAESASSAITGHIYNSLLRYDKNLSLEGDLAERWEVTDGGKTITFYLRQGIKWHDGEPFTVADVLATFKAITDENTRTPYAGDYQLVQAMTTPDAHTVRVTYAEPFAPALSSWAGLAILPKHILDLDADVNETRLKKDPVGTGAYKLSKRLQGQETVLVANESFFRGRPAIDTLRIRVIPDQDTQFLELKAGNLDEMSLKPLQFNRQTATKAFTEAYGKHRYMGSGYTYLGFNLKNPLFADTRIRQALSYATPRQELIDGVLMGHGQAITGVFKPGTWAAADHLQPYAYDLTKAESLMAQAGWVKNNEGVLEKEGKLFAFTLVTNQGNAQRLKTAEILQQAWKKLGVQMEIQVQEWSTFLENTIYPRNFEAFILGWSLGAEPDPHDIWHSSRQGPREFNMIGFSNPEADRLMTAARREFNQEKRQALLHSFQEILHEEQPVLLLYAPYALVAVHKRFKGVEVAPSGIYHNFHEWFVPKSQQKYVAQAELTL